MVDPTAKLINFPEESWLDLIGRIAPDANPKAIEARLQAELKQWLLSPVSKLSAGERALVPKQTLHLSPGGAGVQMLRDEYQDGLRLLMWISAFVLLIVCANVANLMLVRASVRKQQISIRAALGAPRSRQIGQVLTECAVLGLLGGTLGVALAFAGIRLILHLAFPSTYVAIDARPSLPVLAFTFAVSLLTSILFGVAPSWITAKADPADVLRAASRSAGGRERWTQKSLVVAQVSLSLVLLCVAGLLIQSLRNMQHQHFGFETANRYILHIDPQMAGYKPNQLDAFYRQLHDNLQAIPGVAQVSFSMYSPMEGDNWSNTVFIEGQAPPRPDTNQNNASWVRVTAGYFDTIGTKIVHGRDFTDHDTVGSPLVAVVNRTFAERFFKGDNPIGKHFGDLDMKYSGTYEIIGVTEDTQYREPTRKVPPMFFLPAAQKVSYDDTTLAQFEDRNHYLNAVEIRTSGNVPGLEPRVRSAIAEVNPNLAVIDFESFAQQVAENFTQQEMIAKLTSLFGLLALALASVGLYGVTAYSVERRTMEIGIRMALGASRIKILTLVLERAFAQFAIGVAIGILATIFSGRVMQAQLFGVKPYNSNILLHTVALLGIAAFAAAVIPARRAASLQPIRALRTE